MASTSTMTAISVEGDNAIAPAYEVRLQLDPLAVLDAGRNLKSNVLSALGLPATATQMNVGFLDTSCTEIYNAGWCVRVCRVECSSGLKLTYERWSDITGEAIDEALTAANERGFKLNEKDHEIQVIWGHRTQTLAIRCNKEAGPTDGTGVDLPSTRDARRLLREQAPDQFDNWGCKKWGTTTLAATRFFGPVMVGRSIGDWEGMELQVEVWHVLDAEGTGLECIVEASFETDDRVTAANEGTRLQQFLTGKGWFLAEDSSKTQLIMERYGCFPGLENTDLKEC
ncbi:hypothetical protein JDV02_000109 [Purpureocillium takamizusanense]|uniref:CYTH domain-containing protein n=1 Tax=Purpureocillium takamizusanense TaxID=2060973 RepID=A0A9Q8Q441_9HYPO|nr:uncharacterized protein JDV02_000109 [Purpureocillium takamizusanense]UNI13359.1 hypothetical protein JDV02_000109 [Purpureocillium takamizusanense]